MRALALTVLAAAVLVASPAAAQDKRRVPSNGSPLAQQALATGDQPDVLLDVPDLSVDEITLEVDKVEAHIALDARLANLLKLTAGADASIDKVKLSIKGVHAQATLIVRLDNVRAIIERTLQTLDNNPNIINGLYSHGEQHRRHSRRRDQQCAWHRRRRCEQRARHRRRDYIEPPAQRAGARLGKGRSDPAFANHQCDRSDRRQVRDNTGNLTEVVTDTAGKIVSSRRLPR